MGGVTHNFSSYLSFGFPIQFTVVYKSNNNESQIKLL